MIGTGKDWRVPGMSVLDHRYISRLTDRLVRGMNAVSIMMTIFLNR